MSAVVKECRVHDCKHNNRHGVCKRKNININGLKICAYVNTKPAAKESAEDYSQLSVLREVNP